MSQSPTPQSTAAAAALPYASPGTYYSRARDKSLFAWLTVAPLLVATIIGIFFSSYSIMYRLTMPYSQNPWESSILADAHRAAKGQRVYESVKSSTGHATHLYGPLASQTIGLIDRIIGPNWYTGRVLSLIASIGACVVLLFAFADRQRPVEFFICAGLLFCLHFRARAYFVETRPDMIAVFLAILALWAFCYAHRSGKLLWYGPGIAAVISAMLFKQTYIAAAAVPIVVVIISAIRVREHDTSHDVALHPSISLRTHAAVATSPLLAFALCVLLMKFAAPNIYYYMVTVPKMYVVTRNAILWRSLQIFQFAPLFVALGVWFTLIDRRLGEPRLRRPKMLWLIVATAIGSCAGILAAAKRGGSYNSLLLGWVPMTAFCVAMTGPMMDRLLLTVRAPSSAIAGACFFALIMLVTTFGVPKSDYWNFTGAHGGPEFPSVVQAVKKLNGTVVCPDDPMLTLLALNQNGKSLEAELDAVNRPATLPPRMRAEISASQWVVRVHSKYESYLTSDALTALGFRPATNPDSAFGKNYTLWERDPGAATRPSNAKSKKDKKAKKPTGNARGSMAPEDMN